MNTASLPPSIDGHEQEFEPDHPLAALAGFYRAFNARDLAAMAANCGVPTEPPVELTW